MIIEDRLSVYPFSLTLIVGLLAVLTSSLNAQTTRYVTVTGNDLGGTNFCINPDTPCRTITRALNAASDKDTIQIATGIYTESVSIGKSVILLGAGSANTIIQAHNQPAMTESRVITVTGDLDVEITDLTIRHGNADGFFPDNAGGGIYNNGASLVINNVHFNDNTALNGGGMYNQGGSAVLTGVAFNRNEGRWGGGMANSQSSAVLTNVAFNENSAGEDEGGGMYNGNASSPVLVNVTFEKNTAGYGGGIHNTSNSSPELTNVTFLNNEAQFGGGMSNFNGSSPTIIAGSFTGNTAGYGGGMYNFHSSPTLTGVTFLENMTHALGHGGGIMNQTSSPFLTDVNFIQNSALDGGGMYNWEHSSPVLHNVAFLENFIEGYGGGMINKVFSSPILTDVFFTNNEAYNGGGMFNTNNSSPKLIGVTFISNTAKSSGGGMYNSGKSAPSLANIVFYGNSANEYGGGLSNTDNSAPTLVNVTISGNTAGIEGGGIRNRNSNTMLTNSIVWGNMADDGNEIADNIGSTTELHYSLFGNEEGDVVRGSVFVRIWSLIEDPLFIDAPSGDLRLQSASPAIDTGDPVTDLSVFLKNKDEIPIDLDGNPRVFNGRIDMGAYEHNDLATYAEISVELPLSVTLHPNYPNPFNPSTVISFTLPQSSQVELAVFDMLGRRITVLADGFQQAGKHDTRFDAGNLASGVYMYRLRVHNPDAGMNELKVQTGKMILLR